MEATSVLLLISHDSEIQLGQGHASWSEAPQAQQQHLDGALIEAGQAPLPSEGSAASGIVCINYFTPARLSAIRDSFWFFTLILLLSSMQELVRCQRAGQ